MSSTSIPIDTDSSSPIITELIYRLKIRDVMTREVLTATSNDSLRSIQQIMKNNGITGVPIVDDGRLVGVVSMDDVIRALDSHAMDEAASHFMSRKVTVLEDDMPLSFAISYLDRFRFGRFPVLDAGKRLVGIITSRDIIMALLVAINKEVERFEATTSSNVSNAEGFRLEYQTRRFDFEMAGRLSTETKRLLKERSVPPKVMRRVAVATYELEMNQVVHSNGGSVRVIMDTTAAEVEILAIDCGPGIPDVEAALNEGYSTATEWVRSLGFGAGMGLPNTRRVSDTFEISSSPDGTRVRATITLPSGGEP